MKSLLVGSTVLLLLLALLGGAFPSRAEDVLDKARQAQRRVDELQTEHMRQLQELEAKTANAKVPLFNERGDVVRNIKGFWKSVFVNHPSHGNWMHGQDKEILNYLVDFRVEDIGEHQAGFLRHYKISLTFSRENPYFEDRELYREIKGIAQGPDTKVSGIQWIGGKKPQGASFFNFFEVESGAQGTEMLHDHLYNDMAHVMRYEFWPNPFSYYDLPTNERFAAEHAEHVANYQQQLDRANEGGLPPNEDLAVEVQGDIQKGDTPVRTPNTPVGDQQATPSREEVLALREKEEADAKKAAEAQTASSTKDERVEEKIDAEAEKEEKKNAKKETKKETKSQTKGAKKDKSGSDKKKSATKKKKASASESKSQSASQDEPKVDKFVDPEGGAPPAGEDDGF